MKTGRTAQRTEWRDEMYMEIEAMVKREQCQDLQREAEWERLIRQVYAGHQPRRVGAQMWIKRISGWLRMHQRCTRTIVQFKETAVL